MKDDQFNDIPDEVKRIYDSLHASIKIMRWIFIKAIEEGFSEEQALHICGIYLGSMIKNQN